jgi:hypothetical protein
MDAEERERIRQEEFRQQLLDFRDRQLARSMQMQLAEEHSPLAWVAPRLAFALVGMICYLLRGIMVAREPVINKDVFNVVLGALVTAFTTVVSYYFGSSLGSHKKDDAINSGRLTSSANVKATNLQAPQDGTTGQEGAAPPPSSPTGAASGTGARRTDTGSDSSLRIPNAPQLPGRYGLFLQKAPAIMNSLVRDLGLTAVQAAGILGNIGWECGLFRQLQEQNPIGGGRGGLGWCQWTASRRVDFENWLAKRGGISHYQDDDANYGFLLQELRNSQSPSVSAIRRTDDVGGATNEFHEGF